MYCQLATATPIEADGGLGTGLTFYFWAAGLDEYAVYGASLDTVKTTLEIF
ncbi:MAG TPA: hypothetical protein VEK07_13320 [Polyangiaceae bacterium]|nr:hypothetical protein [Polyangiaceae bacterium]